jgi:hypothetical protein
MDGKWVVDEFEKIDDIKIKDYWIYPLVNS